MTELWKNLTSFFDKKNESELVNLADDDMEAGDSTSMLQKIKKNVESSVQVETSYKSFFIVLSIGAIFLILSLLYLPVIVLYPTKFVTLFSIGSLIMLSSFIFIYGTKEYFVMLFKKDRVTFTSLYLASIFVGFYFAYVKGYYIISLVCALVQMITLIIFTLSFLPGGEIGIQFILSILLSPFKKMWDRIRNKS